MKGVFFRQDLQIEYYTVRFTKLRVTKCLAAPAAAASGSAGSRLGGLGLRAVAGVKPAITFQTEGG